MRLIVSLVAVSFFLSCSSSNFVDSERRAEDLIQSGQYQKAAKIYEKIVNEYPKSPEISGAILRLADLRVSFLGDLVKGLDEYEKVIKLDPFSEAARLAHEKRALIFQTNNLAQKAIEEYSVLIKFFPSDEYRMQLAEAYISNKDYDQARIELKPFLFPDKQNSGYRERAIFNIAETYYIEGNPSEAIRFYQAYLEVGQEPALIPEVELKIASCLEEMGYLGMSQKYLKKMPRLLL